MKQLRNLSIGKKLMILIVVSTVALTTVGVMGVSYLRHVAQGSEIMYEDSLLPLNTIMQMRINARASDAYTLEMITTTDAARSKELNEEITSAWQEMDEMAAQLKTGRLLAEEANFIEEYENNAEELKDSRAQVLKLIAENKRTEAYTLYQEAVEPKRKLVNDTLKELQHFDIDNAGMINVLNQKDVNKATIIVAAVIAISLLLLLLIGYMIVRMIVKPLKDVKSLIMEAEKGDFTVKGSYKSKDELGELTESFNQMSSRLQSAFATVHESSLSVASSSEELSASAEQSSQASQHVAVTIQELAAGADRQVDIIKDTSDEMEKMLAHTKTITDHTHNVKNDVVHASEMSQEGTRAIEDVTLQMSSISTNVNGLFEAVRSLDKRSHEIGQIVNVISEISSQTNLLALNAAIEAARAGEQGQGFAVVAHEVRKLAEQSNKSTEQISEIIRLIQQDTENTLHTMNAASDEVSRGLSVVNHAGETFKKIESAVSRVALQVEEIAGELLRIAHGIEHANIKISDVKEVSMESADRSQTISGATEEQLASMEEVAASSQALAGLADDLQRIISQFKIE